MWNWFYFYFFLERMRFFIFCWGKNYGSLSFDGFKFKSKFNTRSCQLVSGKLVLVKFELIELFFLNFLRTLHKKNLKNFPN